MVSRFRFRIAVCICALLGAGGFVQALEVGINIDVHQDIPCVPQQNCPNDFHIEGLICSKGGPPVLVDHVDGLFSPPAGIFNHTIQPANLPEPCWYRFTADWRLQGPMAGQGIPFCTVLHLGLLFDVDAANVLIDLKGWWTRNGMPMGQVIPLPNGGAIPVPGFDVRSDLEAGQVLRIANGRVIQPPEPPPGIPIEIIQMDLVAFPPTAPPNFRDLMEGGAQQTYPWIPVVNMGGIPIGPGAPVMLTPDSFFDVFLEVPGQFRPAQPIHVEPGGFLVARQRIAFMNNARQREERWVWDLHEEQPPEACCLPDGMCIDATPPECIRKQGASQGPGTTCANTICPQPAEACCLPDGACVDVSREKCILEFNGTPQGPGTNCATTDCPVLGACCFGVTAPGCLVTDKLTCELELKGDWKGPGTDCKDANGNQIADACEQPPEACCMPDGRCHMEMPNLCRLSGGVPQGPGSICLGDLNQNGVDEACEGLPIKWVQPPDTNQTGVDVHASKPYILADDFRCTERSLITGITIWGSWRGEMEPDFNRAGNVVFTLSLHTDIPDDPSDPTDYSRPGRVLWIRKFQPGTFLHSVEQANILEWYWNPDTGQIGQDRVCWRYDFQIPREEAFCQYGNPDKPAVFWLDVQADPMTTAVGQFGWKTSFRHWNDDAVWGIGEEPFTGPWKELRYPSNHVWGGQSMDLAFAIRGDEPCEPLGACCIPAAGVPMQCQLTTQMMCELEFRGQWQGPGTNCVDADGDGVADDCEHLVRPLDFGDAPEGALAYPNGVVGAFPTCRTVGPSLWIQHTNFGAWFGPMVDFEPDGNGGLCPLFGPYDNDECQNDADAGLIIPGAYTMGAGGIAPVPCPQSPGMPLGGTCSTAVWGRNIDIRLQNFMPNQTMGFVNVLVDWNQDGQWLGGSACAFAVAPEHVLMNFPVPPGFAGPLSALGPPPFLIGPKAGFVWVRFSLTERPVPVNWDGSGSFEDGETEDYLLQVVDLDWGDAPDPTYPTLSGSNGAAHVIVPNMFLGNLIDAEPDGQPNGSASGDDTTALPDEDGVVLLSSLARGRPATIQVTASVAGRLDAWLDFQQNGNWSDPPDQIFANVPLVAGPNVLTFNVPTSAVLGNTFARFRYSSVGGLSYTGLARDGEVEDYMVRIRPARLIARHVFYNQSYYDGNKPGIDPLPLPGPNNDDADAIDPKKIPLMPGDGMATFPNWTSYEKGITGVIFDVELPSRDPVVGDFLFQDIGKDGAALPIVKVPTAFVVQSLNADTKRVIVTFARGSVMNTWLRVTVGTAFGLASQDVHYWGHAMCDSGAGNNPPFIQVTATDEIMARNNRIVLPARAPVENPYDYNKDGNVTATDEILARNNIVPVPANSVRMIVR